MLKRIPAGGLPALMANSSEQVRGTPHLSAEAYRKLTSKGKVSTPDAQLKQMAELNRVAAGVAVWDHDRLCMTFDGAHLASLDILLDSNHFTLSGYAKSWHNLVALAVHDLSLQQGESVGPFKTADIIVTRFAPRLLDMDNLVPKGLVDGLRYTGVLPDDNPLIVKSVLVRQEVGQHAVTAIISKAA